MKRFQIDRYARGNIEYLNTYHVSLKQKHVFKSVLFHCQAAEALSRLYMNPDEVDLFIGGLSERPLPGAVLGPTFVCIVGDQFSRLRRGDRFFYEEASARFTEGMDLKKKKECYENENPKRIH